MTGIFFFAVVGLWVYVSIKIARWAARNIKNDLLRRSIVCALTMFLLVLPVSDEIVGKYQFKELCEKDAKLKIDIEKIKGKSIRVVIDPSWKKIYGLMLPMAFSHYSYQDATTHEEYASYSIYRVEGGWLIHLLGISEGNAPLTFEHATCQPNGHSRTFSMQYGFKLID